ncbi:pyridoxal 5'-phosphate synthase [Endozoicomonas sp. SM1973]|uniref:Pyridoxal 5'-phosphate synthase n=1 Tax=Spartinivicinus marinus TaxID=2994442 RepID=A0A853IEJ2_9GAMM|nr:pyridoxal 5'-phosphate synthase [Spartinivicinus marinus]MCX4028192.1 pyridoxal 5'-phosphate synthase [Spartinivicinus marinus]NYZ68391.1 pyridoxal 5'-phosphate synthase [Spartinivicinus marinus]
MSSKFESMTGKVDYCFPEYESPSYDPIGLAQNWYQQAVEEKVREPRAMVLVTANSSGMMSSRVMAILAFSNTGIVFATHSCSRKIKDAEESPLACGHFYWKELGRQLSVSGRIKSLGYEQAEEAWSKRPIPLHAMSTVSRQSEPLKSYEQLLTAAQQLEDAGVLPCPDRFKVYVLEPLAIEFWASSSNRLHRRLRFERTETAWESTKLQP